MKKISLNDVVLKLVILLAGFLYYSNLVIAAVPSPDELELIQREQNKIIQEEQLRREELLKEKDMRRRPPGTIDLEIERLQPTQGSSTDCFEITNIVLDGANSLSKEERHVLTQPFIGKCLGLFEIKELMRVITNFYIDKGYVTTRAYIPQQDMSSGTLKILIIEGITGEIELDKKDERTNLATAFPGLKGKVLNIRDIEQGLDQINRLQSNNATMELLPGKEPGKTNILVKNQPAPPGSGSFTLDNYGSKSTGDTRATVTYGVDNPLGLNDYWFTSLSRNIDTLNNTQLSQSALLNFNIPYGYYNFTGSYSESEYKSLIQTPVQVLESTGGTKTPSLGVQYVLKRSQTDKLTLSSQLVHTDTKNYIEGSLLTSSSRRMTALKLELINVFPALKGSWTVSGSVSKGLGLFGVEELPGAGTGTVPVAQFLKYNFSASYTRPFKLMNLNTSWSSNIQAQYATDYLYGAQQISVGGLYTVRGYDGTSISGDRGLYWRNEIATRLPAFTDAKLRKWLGNLQSYFVIDAGFIDSREGQLGGEMVGTAIGLRSSTNGLSFDFSYGVPVYFSKHIEERSPVEDYALSLKISLNI